MTKPSDIPAPNFIQSGAVIKEIIKNTDQNQFNQSPRSYFEDNIPPEPNFIKDISENGQNNAFDQATDNQQIFSDIPIPKNKLNYNMFDLFWICDEKIFNKNFIFDEKKAHFVVLTFNCDFGNLRISFFHITETAIKNHVVFLNELKRLKVGTIYPSTCFRFINDEYSDKITAMEQLITKTNEKWQTERPITQLIKNNKDSITVKITNNKNYEDYQYFTFENWHAQILLHCLKFVYTEGFKIRS